MASLALARELLVPEVPPNSPCVEQVEEVVEEEVVEEGLEQEPDVVEICVTSLVTYHYTMEEVAHLLHVLGRLADRRWGYWHRKGEGEVAETEVIIEETKFITPEDIILINLEKMLEGELKRTQKKKTNDRWMISRGVQEVPELGEIKLGMEAARYREEFSDYCKEQVGEMTNDVSKACDL